MTGQGHRTVKLVAIAASVGELITFAYLGQLLFEDPGFGIVVGALVATGTYLFLPPLMTRGRDGVAPTGGGLPGVDRTALGMGVQVAGVAMLSGGVVFEGDLVLAALLGALVGVVAYLPLSVVVPKRR